MLVLLSAVGFGGIGYLIARSRTAAERGRLEMDLKVAEERVRQAATHTQELRAERDEAKDRADRWEKTQAEQSAERRGQAERLVGLSTELTSVREKLSGAEAEVERLRAAAAGQRQENEALLRDLRERDQQNAALSTVDGQRQRELMECKQQLAGLQVERQALREQAAAVEAARKELDQSREDNNRMQTESFRALAAQMLAASEEKLVAAADGKLSATNAAMRERLEQMDLYLRQFDSQRASADAQLKQQITQLAEENAKGREQTRSLVEALRKPQVRGAWGEMHLKRSVELAGMQEHCDFATQVQVEGDDGRLRPDLVVNLAGGKRVVVDAKVSLAAFLAATEATDDAERERCWADHAKQLRKHVDALAGKEYFRKVAGSPEFVVMFLPGESLLHPALERDPQLLEYAVGKRVIVAGPTNLITMLRTVAFAWTQAALQDNMQQVYELGRELYERLGTLGGHLSTLGTNLGSSVNAYNRAIGSLESRVLVTARKFQTLKVVEDDLKPVRPAEQAVRPLGSAELLASAEAERTVRALPSADANGRAETA
ncbi:DNA recombination protein RmuC [Actinomadura scrupuli]|uniref:DNA recombination protein RmuC n=1 Tax=Actinomadura scrupuli TaxID=559629 RepID=UPI003D980ED3